MFKRIMIAYDSSTHARKSLEKTLALASVCGAQVDLGPLFSCRITQVLQTTLTEVLRTGKKFYQKAHDYALEAAEKKGVRLITRMLHGHVGETLVRYALENKVDLVVVGSHGRSEVGRLLMGSVSDYVAKHSKCPVLIVKEYNE